MTSSQPPNRQRNPAPAGPEPRSVWEDVLAGGNQPGDAPANSLASVQPGLNFAEILLIFRSRARRIVSRRSLSEAVQEAMTRLVANADTIHDWRPGPVLAWLDRTLRRLRIDKYRYRAAQKRAAAEESFDEQMHRGTAEMKSPHDQVCRNELARVLTEAIQTLDDQLQAVMTMKLGGLSHREIARELEPPKSVDQVDRMVNKAVRKLAPKLVKLR